MRFGLWLAVIIALCGVSCSSLFAPETPTVEESPEAARLKKHVLLLPFVNRSQFPTEELVERAQADLETALQSINDVILVRADELGGAESLRYDDVHYDLTLIFDRARGRGIAGVVTGAIEDIAVQVGEPSGLLQTRDDRYEARVSVQLYDTSTGKELLAELSRGVHVDSRVTLFDDRIPAADDGSRAADAVTKALEPILARVPNGLKRIGWYGRIVKIDGNRYYLNAGEETGLLRGELLKVFAESIPIEDKKAGIFIGLAPGRFKGVLKLVDFVGQDGSVATLHSGGGIREQDQVQVMTPQP